MSEIATADVVAQLAHVGWGGWVTLELMTHGVPMWAAMLTTAIVFFGKEAIESIWGLWEDVQPWSSGLIDFAFFMVGIAVSAILAGR